VVSTGRSSPHVVTRLTGLATEGDVEVIATLLGVRDPISGDFAIVTP
jgi:hypothetical protein